MTKEEIIKQLKNGRGFFLRNENFVPVALDSSRCKEFLESKGFNVVQHGVTSTHAYAVTSDGVYLSSSGYISFKEVK